jgi:hypothetical protein
MILHEVLYEINGTLFTTETDYEHSWFCDIEEENLRTYTKEDATRLIAHLKKTYFSEPTHIEITTFYRDGDREYTEVAHEPIQEGVDYDNLSKDEIMARWFYGTVEDAESAYDEHMDMYWDYSRALTIDIMKVVKK